MYNKFHRLTVHNGGMVRDFKQVFDQNYLVGKYPFSKIMSHIIYMYVTMDEKSVIWQIRIF